MDGCGRKYIPSSGVSNLKLDEFVGRPMNSLLEEERRCYEELERMELAAVDCLSKRCRTQREKISQEHNVKTIIDQMKQTRSHILNLQNGEQKRKELESITVIDDMEEFYISLKAIKDHLKIDWTRLMSEHVSDEPSSIGTFKLRREKNCVFFGRDKHCSISAVKPMHCRFTCCPLKVTDPEVRKCLYCSSGTIVEQFRHHVATIVTKRYVEEFGLTLNGEAIENAMSMITQFAEDENILNLFKKDVKDFRYFD